MNWHKLTIPEVFGLLGAGREGLNAADAREGMEQWGPNEIQEGKRRGWAGILLLQFMDVMILILLAAAVISGIIGDITDTIVILVIVVLNAFIGFLQEYRAEKAMQALKKMSVVQAAVMRDGRVWQLPASALVPGDVVLLEAGDAVPADIRMIEAFHLKVEEAALTGESLDIDKTSETLATDELPVADRSNMAFKGTYVTSGRGTGIVVATGMHTELGRIARMLQEKETLTPLQQRMASFGKRLSLIVLLLCGLFFITGWWRGEDPVKMLLTSISLAVAAIPEALPAVITIALALAAKKMIRFHCLIRKLPAVETLGSVTYICTDKTGTLTRNKMQVEEVFAGGRSYGRQELSQLREDEQGRMLLEAFALNNDALADGEGRITGDSTEVALKSVVMGLDVQERGMPRLAEIVFDADRKLMTTFHAAQGGRVIAFTKGAPDVMLERTVDDDKDMLRRQIDRMAARGQRVMGFAYRYWDSLPPDPDGSRHESGLHFLGLAGITDPPREEIKDAVIQCRNAGVVPVIITGDHPLTARAVAGQTGIVRDERDLVITGGELAAMSPAEFSETVERIRVYARVTPEQKLIIVKMLQEKGHFVAMTGDGVNDAPSLKRADIGVAMGITGTDVAKEAADMILLDDNFSTIVKAVREGRRIYDNILKFIKYLMTSNTGELATLLIGPIIGLPVALLPIHILWINLVTDGLPAICLSFEKAESDIMRRPPRPPRESIFAGGRGAHMVWVGSFMAAVALAVQAWAIAHHLHWQTIVFNVICLCQMGHVLAVRSSTRSLFSIGLFSNKPLLGSVTLAFALQFAVTYIPALQPVFRTQALSLSEFIFVGIASSLVFTAVEVQKALSSYFSSSAGTASSGTLV